jgi:predicted alpha/beta hydrolase
MILRDLPALIGAVSALRGGSPLHCLAHSWGGVLLSSALLRLAELRPLVLSLTYFGSKRRVRARTLERLLKVDLVWGLLCPLAVALHGYLPARRLGIGSEDESGPYLAQCLRWVRQDAWVDPADGFDYGEAARRVLLPPTWYLAAKRDGALGHPADVRDFMDSLRSRESRYTLLSRAGGNLHDYDHIDMLTHPDARIDHFPGVASWLEAWSPGASAAAASRAAAGVAAGDSPPEGEGEA